MKPQDAIRESAQDMPGLSLPPALIADTLDAVEREQGVTFMALANDDLAAVREAYDYLRGNTDDLRGNNLADAVRDLLGLEG